MSGPEPHRKTTTPARRGVVVLCLALGCGEPRVTGEGQFGRGIELMSNPQNPLPRLVWRPGASCPGPEGGCDSLCEGPPESCADACRPILIDSGTPLTLLPTDGAFDFGRDCIELRSGEGLAEDPNNPEALDGATASFRLNGAPIVWAPSDAVGGWAWNAGDELESIAVGGVIGGNVLRDFAVSLRHLEGDAPEIAFYTQYPGSEEVLGDQGRAFLRLQHPGRLLGRLLNDRCEFGTGVDCRLSRFSLSQNDQDLLFDSTRALVDACIAPPPCTVAWKGGKSCSLTSGGASTEPCPHEQGGSATLLVATGVPGLVLFDDSAIQLLGDLATLPDCGAGVEATTLACRESTEGRLVLPGWPALESLLRLRVRAVGIVQGLDQPSGSSPCSRLRARLEGLVDQCEGFVAEGRPMHPLARTGTSVGSSALVLGEASLGEFATAPDPDVWVETLVVPATASPVLALRREIVPEGAQPDGLIGGAMLRNTETVLDFTESIESVGVRVRCLDPGPQCQSIPACVADDVAAVGTQDIDPGRTSCCFGLPTNLVATVVLGGVGKQAPRVEDACCGALSRAAIEDLQSIDLCSGIDLP